jgi:glycine betaine/proline transport system permease protein
LGNAAEATSDWAKVHLFDLTNGIRSAVSYGLLNPFQGLIAESPWYVVAAAILALAWTLAGARSLVVVGACLAALLALGLWEESMVTMTSVIVATIITIAIGVALGVPLAHSRRGDLAVRPVLDAAQAMPPFVYLEPVLGLFGPSRLSAIFAAVIFAAPVATKIVAAGIRTVPATVVEAATASGSSRWQVTTKVELPMARHALALAANQGLIYVLSMVVIGGLVGGGALGYLVVAGLAQSALHGKGLAAGIAIVALTVLLDRFTLSAARRVDRTTPGIGGPA